MRLELKLAFIGALSKVVIFAVLALLVEKVIYTQALKHTDRDLVKMKDKTMSIVGKIGIKSFLDIEKDSVYASYNMLKDEYITIDMTPPKGKSALTFTNEAREIEGDEFDFRILNYSFTADNQQYLLEIGKNIQLINSLNKTLRDISINLILMVLLLTIVIDIGINKYLLHPLNRTIIPKLKDTTNPEKYDYSEIASTTSDFVYLNNTLNELMHKVTTILNNQQRFTADVSHELFTPISIMQNKLENLLTSGTLPEPFITNVIDLQNHLNRLQQIIKALLLIARIENDQYAKKDTVNLRELLGEIIENIEDRAQMRNIRIENMVSQEINLHQVNRSLIYILFFNLVSNAIKYNKEGGWIRIRSYEANQKQFIEVSDNGLGIDQEQLPHIFNRFRRADPTLGEGHGLGLSIVNSIIHFHQGTIEVQSVKDEGSIFCVQFSLKNVKESGDH